MSAEETFAADIREPADLTRQLTALADRVAARLRAHGLAAGRVSVKIRRASFETCSRQRALGSPTQDTAAVSAMALRLLREWLDEHPNAALRLLGVGAGDLQTSRQGDLFSGGSPRDSRLDAALDGIRDRFGSQLLTRASLLARPRSPAPRRG